MSKKEGKQIQRQWRLFDAKGRILGRLSTEIALALRGKHQPTFRPHEDTGDVVVVLNTDHVQVTGNKRQKKLYRWHTWHPKGFRELTFEQMMKKDSRLVIRDAVYGMLPKNKLRSRMITRLKLYKGAEHPHSAAPFQPLSAKASGGGPFQGTS